MALEIFPQAFVLDKSHEHTEFTRGYTRAFSRLLKAFDLRLLLKNVRQTGRQTHGERQVASKSRTP